MAVLTPPDLPGALALTIPLDEIDNVGEDAGLASEAFELRPFSISADLHGQRLDQALASLVPEFSRSYLQQLILLGAVQMGRQSTGEFVPSTRSDKLRNTPSHKPSSRVKAGEQGVIELRPTPQSQAFKPEPIRFDTVFCDNYLRVISKPADLVVHPAPGNWSGTLLNGLLALDAQSQSLPRTGIVHRLDKDTSGLMVIARTRAVMDALVEMIAARQVKREYLALVHRRMAGPPAPQIKQVEWPIGRDPRNRLRMAVVDLSRDAGKTAHTTVTLLEAADAASLVHCQLHTGRTHQIRVHMAALGHPLVADNVYGGVQAGGLLRQALHARRLAFEHPVTGESLTFELPCPFDMVVAAQALGLRYNLG